MGLRGQSGEHSRVNDPADGHGAGYPSGPLAVTLLGIVISVLAVVGTIVLITDLNELGLEGVAWRHEAWQAVLVGASSFGVGVAVASLGVILGRSAIGRERERVTDRGVLDGLRAPHR